MNEIRIEESRLAGDIGQFEECMQRFSNSQTAMQNSINELNKTWSGAAHDAFVQSFQNDMTLMNEVWNILADMLEAMRYAKASYQQCDAEVNAVVSAISVGGKGRF